MFLISSLHNSVFNCRCYISLCNISPIRLFPEATLNNKAISILATKQQPLSTDVSCTCVLNGNFYSDFSCIRFSENPPYLSHLQIYVSHILQIELARGWERAGIRLTKGPGRSFLAAKIARFSSGFRLGAVISGDAVNPGNFLRVIPNVRYRFTNRLAFQ